MAKTRSRAIRRIFGGRTADLVANALWQSQEGAGLVLRRKLYFDSLKLRGRRFAELVRQAYDVTQVRISLGAIERGDAGRREAMPYFLAVLRDLVIHDGGTRSPGCPAAHE